MTPRTRTEPTAPDPAAADAPALKVQPQVTVKLGVVATALNIVGAYELHWGDGMHTDATAGMPALHSYASAAAYALVARQGGAIVAQAQVYVRDTLAPTVTHAATADNPNIVEFTVGDDPADLVSRYLVDFGDGSAAEERYLPKGAVLSHGYKAGTYTATVTDLHTGRVLRQPVEVKDKEYEPDFSIAQGAAGTMSAKVTLTKAAGTKEVWVDWGDGTQRASLPNAAVGATAEHTYADADTYIVQVVYADGSTEGAARVVTVPFAAAGGVGGSGQS